MTVPVLLDMAASNLATLEELQRWERWWQQANPRRTLVLVRRSEFLREWVVDPANRAALDARYGSQAWVQHTETSCTIQYVITSLTGCPAPTPETAESPAPTDSCASRGVCTEECVLFALVYRAWVDSVARHDDRDHGAGLCARIVARLREARAREDT